MINFILNNNSNIFSIAVMTLLISAVLSAFYFLIYKYVANHRLKRPDKQYKFRLIAPRFMCIVIVLLTFAGVYKIPSRSAWVTDYAFARTFLDEGDADEIGCDTEEDFRSNPHFNKNIVETVVGDFKYTVFFNDSFNGICNSYDPKNCEFAVVIDYLGDKKKDIAEVNTIFQDTGDERNGYGFAASFGQMPATIYCASDRYNHLSINLSLYTKADYNRMNDYFLYHDEDLPDSENYSYYNSTVKLNIQKKSFNEGQVTTVNVDDLQSCREETNALLSQIAAGSGYSELNSGLKQIISEENYNKMNFRTEKPSKKKNYESFNYSYPEANGEDDKIIVKYTYFSEISSLNKPLEKNTKTAYVTFEKKGELWTVVNIGKKI